MAYSTAWGRIDGGDPAWEKLLDLEVGLDVIIPTLPPSTNQLLGYRRDGRVYKTEEAKAWAKGAALIIGAANQGREWDSWWLELWFDVCLPNISWRDIDNFEKLAIDTLAAKLGFDDRYILTKHITKWPTEEKMRIRLKKLGSLKKEKS